MTEETTIKKTWASGLLTPQTLIYLFGGMIALVVFWIKTQESWEKTKAIEGVQKAFQEAKADRADLKAVEERVTRQYEQLGKMSERITALEKQQEYQRGKADAIKETSHQ